ncbi:LOG family protein [Arthrobacter sp. H14-L1]|uniref:LOG family protein n=1 Tax=Arthrobacter sp. H14-L1 TaxID=2996697 RepID=UPI00227226F7|nr:LOG family protein [Arthrobacter sp. H14-L1]MCY0904822.1 LOG family protein [Arthrobacter sp. H14-L1]
MEVADLLRFDKLVEAGATSMHGWHLQSLDLRGRTPVLARMDAAGAVFLGCSFAAGAESDLRSRGALIFPFLPGIPFDSYRGRLYTGAELYAGVKTSTYEQTLDARIYQWTLRSGAHPGLDATLATAMHDHAIGDALDGLLGNSVPDHSSAHSGPSAGRKLVGVMGGHAAVRGSKEYDDAARLGRLLALSGFVVTTGGGPGAMEAANLGAYLSAHVVGDLDGALESLAAVPGFRPSVSAWAAAALAVVDRYPSGTANLGIPTWFYGHEPPNVFATGIAKFFANSIREAVLLSRCTGGIVFLPGAAGTVQEIFQDACENYYAAPEAVAPMILVGQEYWENTLPVWPLLQLLAKGRPMEGHLHLVETPDDALAVLRRRAGRVR